MPWGDGTGPWWAGSEFGKGWRGKGFGRGFGRGRGYGYGWPRGYCWYYYQQNGQFPSWSPWSYTSGFSAQRDVPSSTPGTASSARLDQLETMKKSLEEQLKTLENQIKELRSSMKGD